MKATLWTGFARDEILAALAQVPNLSVAVAGNKTEFQALAADADAVLLPGYAYDADVARTLRDAPRLRWIQILTAGYEGPQIHGVPASVTLTNAGAAWAPAVAEHAVTLLLAMTKRLPQAFAAQASGRWDRAFSAAMDTLDGKTLAVIGFGNIGREVARRARGFGARIIGVARTARASELAEEVTTLDRLHEVLGRSDAVVLALPWSPDTNGLINAAALAACRPGALLVNIARGGLVDGEALRQALERGHLGGAALDVTDPEPLPEGHALWGCPNLIITPHVAGACGESGRRRLAETAASNAAAFVGQRPLQHIVAG